MKSATWTAVAMAAAAIVASAPAMGNQLINGGFETPALSPSGFTVVGSGSEPAGFGWTVPSGTVDVAYLPLPQFNINWPAYEGNQLLDLNGNGSGAIVQTFATIPGQAYKITFAYTDNPVAGGVSSADLAVSDFTSFAPLLTGSISHSTSTSSSPDFALYSGGFVAADEVTVVQFTSTSVDTGSSGGIFLDAVDISPVPEPAALALVAVAAIGIALRKRR